MVMGLRSAAAHMLRRLSRPSAAGSCNASSTASPTKVTARTHLPSANSSGSSPTCKERVAADALQVSVHCPPCMHVTTVTYCTHEAFLIASSVTLAMLCGAWTEHQCTRLYGSATSR